MKQGRVVKECFPLISAQSVTGQMLIDNPDSVDLYLRVLGGKNPLAGGAGIAGFYTPVGCRTC